MAFLVDLHDIIEDLVRALLPKSPVDQGFRVSRDRSERRFQFVGDRRYEESSLLFLPGGSRDIFKHDDPSAKCGLREEWLTEMELDDPVLNLNSCRYGFEFLALGKFIVRFRRSLLRQIRLIQTELHQNILVRHECLDKFGKGLRECLHAEFFQTGLIVKKKCSFFSKSDHTHLHDVHDRVTDTIGGIQKHQVSFFLIERQPENVIDKQTCDHGTEHKSYKKHGNGFENPVPY